MEKILIVEDDVGISSFVNLELRHENYETEVVDDGRKALELFSQDSYDLILLDIMLPGLNGIEVLRRIRKTSNVPIILLTAKSDTIDKVQGLDGGADDYITKPFNPLELVARVNSNIRRYVKLGSIKQTESSGDEIYSSGDLILNDDTKKVTVDGKEIKLTATEYNILKFLLKNKGKVYSISEIYENVWKEPSYNAENTVAVHIRRIREKIEINPKDPKYFKVVWGIGYKIEKY